MTAVQWFYDILTSENWEYKTFEEQDSIFQKVMAMEKEQIMAAHNQGYADGYRDNGNSPIDYYTETYNA